jgi:hypothetical protein
MDRIFNSWLESQLIDGMALARSSDRLILLPEAETPPRNYIARFDCLTMIHDGDESKLWRGCDVLLRFPLDYLRVVGDPGWIVSLLSPGNLYHPNVRPPFMCIGRIPPGTSLCELIVQVHEVVTYQKFTPREDDALNRDACAWARTNMQRFPLDARPLRRQVADFEVRSIAQGAPNAA